MRTQQPAKWGNQGIIRRWRFVQKARRGETKNFTGIDSALEAPEMPELR
jgi:hypothetical protein